MKAQYQILAEVKRFDEKIARIDSELERIPQDIRKMEHELKSNGEEQQKCKGQLDDSEKKLRKAELDLKEREEKLRKAEEKLMEVRTNEEYQAALKENQTHKEEKSEFEDSVLSLLTQVEEQRRKFKEIEREFQKSEGSIKEGIFSLEAERKKLLERREEDLKRKQAIAAQLAPEVAALYQRVSSRMSGIAVVIVENGMCVGCNMTIRPQLYNEIIGYKALHRCPTCGRILISLSSEMDTSDGELIAK